MFDRTMTAAGAALVLLGLAACAAHPQAAETGQAANKVFRKAVADFSTCTKPTYPEADLEAGHAGTVKLRFLVKADGSVADSKVATSSGYPALDEEARRAMAGCRFSPATRGGQAVDAWTDVWYVWTGK